MSRQIRVVCTAENHMVYGGGRDFKAMAHQAADFIERQITGTLVERPDLIVLPEVYDRFCGISREDNNEYYKERGNIVYDRVKHLAKENNVNIVFSAVMDGGDGYMRNRQMFVGRDGEEKGIYDKNHLVWEEHTESNIAFGDDPTLIEMDIGKLGGVICYDLNFDELREKYIKLKPELLCFSSMYHGGYVARNWAYTNRCYFAASVQQKQSYIINPLGEYVAQSNPYTVYAAADINLDYAVAHLDYNWQKKQDLKGKYGKFVDIQIPRGLGPFLITSLHPEISAIQMAQEFEIELMDELFARGRKQRADFLQSRNK